MPATAFSVDDLAAAPSPCGRRRKSSPCPRFASLRWRQPPSQPPALSRSRPARARPRAARAPTHTRAWAAASSRAAWPPRSRRRRRRASATATSTAGSASARRPRPERDGRVDPDRVHLRAERLAEQHLLRDPAPRPSRRLPRAAEQRRRRPSTPVRRPRNRRAAELVACLARRLARLCTRLPPGKPRQVDGAGRRRELRRNDERRLQRLLLLVRKGQIREPDAPERLESLPHVPAVPGPELPARAALGIELRCPQRLRSDADVGRDEPVTRTGRPRGAVPFSVDEGVEARTSCRSPSWPCAP